MTVWAILSDVHGRVDRLRRALADAEKLGAQRVLFLGDAGGAHVLDALYAAGATCVFGNWEASGLRGLNQPWRGQVARWPAQFRGADFLAVHASPVWPDGLGIGGVVDHLRTHGLHWTALFPSLQRSEEARSAAFAALEAAGVSLCFHGHTHVQEAWLRQPGGSAEPLAGPDFPIPMDGGRVLVGVGSVGDPHDGDGCCYALYDDALRQVTWRRVWNSSSIG